MFLSWTGNISKFDENQKPMSNGKVMELQIQVWELTVHSLTEHLKKSKKYEP